MEEIQQLLSHPLVSKIIILIIGIGLVWFIIKLVKRNIFTRIKENDNRYRARKFAHFTGYLLTILIVTIVFSDKLGGLTVAFGVAGAGIAFALQEVIASFAGWLAIMFAGFYKTGDRVQLGGIKGDVMDIGVLRTTIMETGQWVDGDLYNGRIVFIANSFVFKEPVFNYSGDYPFLWDEIKINIQFGSNYEMAQKILYDAGSKIAGMLTDESQQMWHNLQRKYRLEKAQILPMVSMAITSGGLEYTLRYVVDYKRRRTTKTDMYSYIVSEIEKSDNEVKFQSSTLQLVEPPDLNVNIKSDESKKDR